ncbi:hypothetical protein ASPCADRAFT_7470 [Aspergillus carbonarius ITEM 5010]|uniref:2EXR domain-containing protein n=1 Tax=Aspergillus carbonarius (strain ITEM 5010) TaxID=602072 RepID=A0A1R3RHM8_ASPC5|nr:hypothetical protein ASPCADRAFT_7470 [Aspergillus carbonarius ITEM 5010]
MTAPGAGFPLFPYLPTELRLLIWEETLPKIRRPLYIYRVGCWRKQPVSETRIRYEFEHRHLGDLKFHTSLPFVNRETRYVVSRWIHKHGIKIVYDAATETFVFKRSFNPQSDVMFIPSAKWIQFNHDPWLPIYIRHFESIEVTVSGPGFTHIAMPVTIIERKRYFLREFFYRWAWGTIEKMFFVTNAQDMLEENAIKAGQQWELNSFTGFPIFVWNSERRLFEAHNNVPYETSWDSVLEKLQEASAGMMDWHGWQEGHQLEVHFVSVNRM